VGKGVLHLFLFLPQADTAMLQQ